MRKFGSYGESKVIVEVFRQHKSNGSLGDGRRVKTSMGVEKSVYRFPHF